LGIQDQIDSDQADTRIRRTAPPWLHGQGRARDARTQREPVAAPLHSFRIARSNGIDPLPLVLPTEFTLVRIHPRVGREISAGDQQRQVFTPRWRPAQPSAGERRTYAIRLWDAGRSQTRHRWRLLGPVTTSRSRRREMTEELGRLMTITDLSKMLGVPVDTLCRWRHRGEGHRGLSNRSPPSPRRATVEAWLDAQADRSSS
jgi:hypothetical protein